MYGHHRNGEKSVPERFKVLFWTLQRVSRESSSLLKVPCIRYGCVARGLDSEHAECGGVHFINVIYSDVSFFVPPPVSRVKSTETGALAPRNCTNRIGQYCYQLCPPTRWVYWYNSIFQIITPYLLIYLLT